MSVDPIRCPKCGNTSGDDWTQCLGACPMEQSPHYNAKAATATKFGKYDNVLVPFVAHMERELHANAHKGDRPSWLNLTRDSAMFEIYDHSAKLAHAVRVDDHERIKEHAADIANACMMLLDAWSLLVDPITGKASA